MSGNEFKSTTELVLSFRVYSSPIPSFGWQTSLQVHNPLGFVTMLKEASILVGCVHVQCVY